MSRDSCSVGSVAGRPVTVNPPPVTRRPAGQLAVAMFDWPGLIVTGVPASVVMSGSAA
jgi:hypothetical protein